AVSLSNPSSPPLGHHGNLHLFAHAHDALDHAFAYFPPPTRARPAHEDLRDSLRAGKLHNLLRHIAAVQHLGADMQVARETQVAIHTFIGVLRRLRHVDGNALAVQIVRHAFATADEHG